MKSHISNVATFMSLAGQPVPSCPVIPPKEDLILRAKLIMEEAHELIDGLGITIRAASTVYGGDSIRDKPLYYEISHDFDPVAVMDGAADLLWVGVSGTAVMCGLAEKLPAIIDEVDRSNLSKFVDGHRRDDGKWVKGPSYSPANISEIIGDVNKRVLN